MKGGPPIARGSTVKGFFFCTVALQAKAIRSRSFTTVLNGRPVRRASAFRRAATSSSRVSVVLIHQDAIKRATDVKLPPGLPPPRQDTLSAVPTSVDEISAVQYWHLAPRASFGRSCLGCAAIENLVTLISTGVKHAAALSFLHWLER
jgi:hypothetical protein